MRPLEVILFLILALLVLSALEDRQQIQSLGLRLEKCECEPFGVSRERSTEIATIWFP